KLVGVGVEMEEFAALSRAGPAFFDVNINGLRRVTGEIESENVGAIQQVGSDVVRQPANTPIVKDGLFVKRNGPVGFGHLAFKSQEVRGDELAKDSLWRRFTQLRRSRSLLGGAAFPFLAGDIAQRRLVRRLLRKAEASQQQQNRDAPKEPLRHGFTTAVGCVSI